MREGTCGSFVFVFVFLLSVLSTMSIQRDLRANDFACAWRREQRHTARSAVEFLALCGFVSLCACVCVCVRVSLCVCVCVCLCVSLCVWSTSIMLSEAPWTQLDLANWPASNMIGTVSSKLHCAKGPTFSFDNPCLLSGVTLPVFVMV